MDVFQELPVEQWPHLMQKVKALWPLNIGGYYALQQNLKYTSIREHFQFKVYCPYGDIDIGFIAMTKPAQETRIIIFSNSKDTKKLEDALLNTKLIDWRALNVGMAPSIVLELLQKIKPQIELNVFELCEVKLFYLDKSAKPFEDLKCPPDTYMTEVKQKDIKRVDSLWPHRFEQSDKMFSCFASNGLSYGLYSRDNELLAWMFINEYGFLCHLFCEENHRRKGYAEYVLKYVVNKLLPVRDAYAFVVFGNEASEKLFLKHKFQHRDDAAWVDLGKV